MAFNIYRLVGLRYVVKRNGGYTFCQTDSVRYLLICIAFRARELVILRLLDAFVLFEHNLHISPLVQS